MKKLLITSIAFILCLYLGTPAIASPIKYKTISVDDLNIFYREAGDTTKPLILLLHGFPSSSHMYRDLINDLSSNYHLIAPDYPGFGLSSCPPANEFNCSFDHIASIMEDFIVKLNINRFSLYMQDYGGPIGFRIAAKHPSWISTLIIQNANVYNDGLGRDFKKIMQMEDAEEKVGVEKILQFIISFDGIKLQYTEGAKDLEVINPDAYQFDYALISRKGSESIQNELFQDYHTNLSKYPEWQKYLRTYQPPALIVWGENDRIFTTPGGIAYQKDIKNAEVHLLNGGHFALEEYHTEIAGYIRSFLNKLDIR